MSKSRERLGAVVDQRRAVFEPSLSWAAGAPPVLFLLLLVLTHQLPHQWSTFTLTMITLVVLTVVPTLYSRYYRYAHRRPTGQEGVQRTNEQRDLNRGMASEGQLYTKVSVAAVKEHATTIRPSLIGVDLNRISPTEYATHLCDAVVALGAVGKTFPVMQSLEGNTCRFGAPRIGKTVGVVDTCLDAPGALVTASTKLELAELTSTFRSRKGTIYLFNPMEYAGLLSNLVWSPLSGCEDLSTARRRAIDGIKSALGNDAFFTDQARTYLGIIFHIVALDGGDMLDVKKHLVGGAEPNEPVVVAARQQMFRLMKKHEVDSGVMPVMDGYYKATGRTRSGITMTIEKTLNWLSSPSARRMSGGGMDTSSLDIRKFIEDGRDTLHIISSQDLGDVTPLASMLLAEFAEQARRISQNAFGLTKRIDPPLTMVLDEARLSCPQVPLISWTADMGGKGVTLHLVFQSPADIRECWGREALNIVATNCTIMIMGGVKGPDDMPWLSDLCGFYTVNRDNEGAAGQERVWSGADLATLGKFEVVIPAMPGVRPIFGTVPKYYEREEWQEAMADQANWWRPEMVPGAPELTPLDTTAELALMEVS